MASSAIDSCADFSDAIELEPAIGFYLKPLCKANICLLLPTSLSKQCISVSNWELQEKIRDLARPLRLLSLRVLKSSMNIVRFEAELANRKDLKQFIDRMDTSMKLQGWPESAKVRCAEAKLSFPSRHDWEVFFRDAKGLDEMKPGERPDTLYIRGLPIKWFTETPHPEPGTELQPSLTILHRVFRAIADVRCVDIPVLDLQPEEKLKSNSFGKIGNDLVFDAFVQYRDYVGFVKAMDTLRGMKLLYRPPQPSSRGDTLDCRGPAFTANINVDFDRTSHLSDAKIRARSIKNAKAKKLLLNVVRKEQLKRKLSEEQEALKKQKIEFNKQQLHQEAQRLCRRLVKIVEKEARREVESTPQSGQQVLLQQEQQLRERLLRKLQEKRVLEQGDRVT